MNIITGQCTIQGCHYTGMHQFYFNDLIRKQAKSKRLTIWEHIQAIYTQLAIIARLEAGSHSQVFLLCCHLDRKSIYFNRTNSILGAVKNIWSY